MLPGTTLRARALVIGCVLVSTLPFVNKAFHIDDPAYVAVARNVLEDPLRPFAGAEHKLAVNPETWIETSDLIADLKISARGPIP